MSTCSPYLGRFFFWMGELFLSFFFQYPFIIVHEEFILIMVISANEMDGVRSHAVSLSILPISFTVSSYMFYFPQHRFSAISSYFLSLSCNLLSASLFYSPTSFIYFKTDTLLLLKLHPLILLEGWALISCE